MRKIVLMIGLMLGGLYVVGAVAPPPTAASADASHPNPYTQKLLGMR